MLNSWSCSFNWKFFIGTIPLSHFFLSILFIYTFMLLFPSLSFSSQYKKKYWATLAKFVIRNYSFSTIFGHSFSHFVFPLNQFYAWKFVENLQKNLIRGLKLKTNLDFSVVSVSNFPSSLSIISVVSIIGHEVEVNTSKNVVFDHGHYESVSSIHF